MAKAILIDEFHLTFRAPSGLPEAAYGAMRRVLDDRRFQAALRHADRQVRRRHPALAQARVRLTR
jgi:hypothetical protein